MANYHLTHKAVEDITNIWGYTVNIWSEQQAEKYYNLLINSFTRILENPFIGIKYEEVLLGLFGYTQIHFYINRSIAGQQILR